MSLGIAYAGALLFLLVIKAGSYDDIYTKYSKWTPLQVQDSSIGAFTDGVKNLRVFTGHKRTKILVTPILLPNHESYARIT